MKRSSLSVLGCPRCFGRLTIGSDEGDVQEGTLLCDRDGIRFPVRGGVAELVRPDRVSRLNSFSDSYGEAWERANQAWFDSTQLLALPYVPRFSQNRAVWRVKARSMEALLRFLERRSPKRVLDLGSGNGWLSSHLARQGYETYSVDAVNRSDKGLLASDAFVQNGPYFERARGEIEFPPFQDAVFDVVVCNASLHYTDSLKDDFVQGSRILASGGAFVVMNSPVHDDPESAARAQEGARSRLIRSGSPPSITNRYHHYTFEEMGAAFRATFDSYDEIPWDPGLAFRVLRRAKAAALGIELARFPILWGKKSASDRAG
jgi:SAM-dependent methyltransferase/uncharacterized protein YbaR (Trm112 family)